MRQSRPFLFLPLAGLALLLAACGGDPLEEVPAEGEASGEVFEGTISDAMIPLDELRSQPPFEAVQPATRPGVSGAEDGSTAEEAEGETPLSDGSAPAADDAAPPEPVAAAE